MEKKKIAVILFNLGGPDSPEAILPFLQNLFNDKYIISLPQPFRWIVSRFIARKRYPTAKENYAFLGDKSPILEQTQAQQVSLEMILNQEENNCSYKVFVAMRYWHPFTNEVVREVEAFQPEEVVLLPLYPQFSTTTSYSSFVEWKKEFRKRRIKAKEKIICCYPTNDKLIESHVALLMPTYKKAQKKGKPRILFSAHGLPKKIIASGDPYQWQVEQTAAAIIADMGIKNVDYSVCYQSKVGPLEWIGPSLDEEIKRASSHNVPIVVVPIAFVSEHSETLVELDIEYKNMAKEFGINDYYRVPTLQKDNLFIEALAKLCTDAVKSRKRFCNPTRLCPVQSKKCPCRGSL